MLIVTCMHCPSFQNYTDYFKCIAAKGEDYAPCKQFKRAYNSLCPSASYSLTLCNPFLIPCSSTDEWVCFCSPPRTATFFLTSVPDFEVG